MMKTKVSPDYDAHLHVRAPRPLVAAVATAAGKELTAMSSYVRSAVLAKLRADGCEPKEAA
jgi:hypothetical protein